MGVLNANPSSCECGAVHALHLLHTATCCNVVMLICRTVQASTDAQKGLKRQRAEVLQREKERQRAQVEPDQAQKQLPRNCTASDALTKPWR